MFTSNPFAELSATVPPAVMQAYVVIMIVLVAAGTLFDIVHKGSARYFFDNWRKSNSKPLGGGELVSLAVQNYDNRGISEVLSAHDVQLVLLVPQSRADEARVAHYLSARHVDGALLVSLHGDDPLPTLLEERGLPVVVGARPPAHQANISYVDVDNRSGALSGVRQCSFSTLSATP